MAKSKKAEVIALKLRGLSNRTVAKATKSCPKTVKKYLEHPDATRKVGSGRKTTIPKDDIGAAIKADPEKSIRQHGQDFNISEGSIRRVMKKQGLKSRAKVKKPALSKNLQERRLVKAKKALNKLKKG